MRSINNYLIAIKKGKEDQARYTYSMNSEM